MGKQFIENINSFLLSLFKTEIELDNCSEWNDNLHIL
jgi:hypothetical protein